MVERLVEMKRGRRERIEKRLPLFLQVLRV